MAITDWDLNTPRGLEPSASVACSGAEVKAMLNTIVSQLTDADRRHTDALQHMQDRLAAMASEANSIRDSVPGVFAEAFEHIEIGMAELGERLAEAARCKEFAASSDEPAPLEPVRAAHAMQPAPAVTRSAPAAHAGPSFRQDAPAALRSASDAPAVHRTLAGIDPFDIIESTLSGGGADADPWDRDAADALTGLYDAAAPAFAAQFMTATSPGAAATVLDQAWLEPRLADIAKRLQDSLAEFNPDRSFFALGQRLETVERTITRLSETAATHVDVEGIRFIEAQVTEFAGLLYHAQAQLARIDGIEARLGEIASRLADVHQFALRAGPKPAAGPAAFDDESARTIARAAIEEAKHSFVQPQQGDDARELVERLMAEGRAGDENTAALLDTLQLAMIRLLDRIDAMEMTQQQAIDAHAQLAAQAAEAVAQTARGDYGYEPAMPRAPAIAADLDDAVTSFAAARATARYEAEHPEPQPAPAAPRSPERMRQDFIADARRARQRLSNESEDAGEEIGIARTDALAGVAPGKSAGKPSTAPQKFAPKVGAAIAIGGTQSSSAPRLAVIALACLSLLGGAWYMLGGSASGPVIDAMPAISRDAPGASPSSAAADSGSDAPAAQPSGDQGDSGGPNLNAPPGTRGEIVTDDVVVGQTSVPLLGIAVDTETPATAAEIERAQRRQSMAAMSGKLGHAAAQMSANAATPASLIPEDPNQAAKTSNALAQGGMSKSSALDLPPATVGPLSLRLAAANGDPSAEFDVGARLAEGKGGEGDFKQAAKWYQRSADKGFAQAQYRLGTLYERGLGLKADPARATAWYEKAASAGNIKAMHNLAVLSANQSGSSPDYTTAARWFSDAADRGLSDSQFNLAVLYENGLGVEKNMQQAYKWLALAARNGDSEAIKRRDNLKGKLTQAELDAAEALVKTWRVKPADSLINDARAAADAWKKNPANGVRG